jgi:oligopeptide transport system permease protein
MVAGEGLREIGSQGQIPSTPEWKRIWRTFRRNKAALAGGAFVIFLLLLVVLGPEILPYKYNQSDFSRLLEPPSASHWLGTDSLGRDILARLAFGGRVSLGVAVLANSVILFIGMPLGLLSGYFGGWFDILVMRVVDTLWALPNVMLMIAVMSFLNSWVEYAEPGPFFFIARAYDATGGLIALFIGFAAGWWLGDCRVIRGMVLSLREKQFVLAARCVGATDPRILLRHILPNVIPIALVSMALGVPGAVVTEAGLSFLGLGVRPPTPSWGSMISEGTTYLLGAPHILISPAVILALTTISLNFLADGLRDAMDPWMRGR